MDQQQPKPNYWKYLTAFLALSLVGGFVAFIAGAFSPQKQTPIVPLVAQTSAAPTANAPAAPATSSSSAVDQKIKGNKNSKIFHLPGCGSYDRISARNIVWFKTSDEAEAAGYRMAKNC